MTPIERAREAAVFADARADAVRAVLHRRIKDDFHTVIQHADGSRTHAVSHDQELANAAIDTFLASLSAQGLVIVPNGRRADRDNPDGKGMCTLDMLHGGMAVMSPARRAAIKDRDDAGNLVGDIYRAMISAYQEQGE